VSKVLSNEQITIQGGTVNEERSPRDVRQEMENEHRNELLKSRSEGANQFPIEVINEKSRVYANESMRIALAQQNR
jgi:hypothetical protein